MSVGLAGLAMLGWLAFKVRRIHLKTFEIENRTTLTLKRIKNESAHQFQQTQSLRLLEHTLGVDRPLPPMRGWAASPDILLALVKHVLERRPECIVECGSGVSTLVLALACRKVGRGRIVSIDHAPEFAARTRAMLEEWGVGDRTEVLGTPIVERWVEGRTAPWYGEVSLPDRIDLLFVDGPPARTGPEARWPAGPLLIPRLGPGGAVYVDDGDRPDEQAMIRDWMDRFPHLTLEDLHCEKGGYRLSAPPG
ncbi:class I SAM-dependent methyltransferase [Arenibaculum sp.]|uniref:O-methyltransferase n=1 Tax=Arenibaculum sp. TaxID=2865862 RepID=UPI002E12ABCD|nr:class I SAM-dependent methyltransferase [Arenibaculum sp.]